MGNEQLPQASGFAEHPDDLPGGSDWFATTLRSIGDAVIATDAAARILFMNAVAEGLTGWKLADARGMSLNEVFLIISAETRQLVESPVDRVLKEGKVVGLANHTLLIARDGTELPIDDSGAPIRDAAGDLSGVVLVFRDITERERADRRTRAQYEVSRIIAAGGMLDEAMPALLRTIGETLGWACGFFWTIDRNTDTLRARSAWHANEPGLAAFASATRETSLPRGVGLPGRTWLHDAPAWIADVLSDGNFPRRPDAAHAGLCGAFAFPIRGDAGPLGTIEYFSHAAQAPDEPLLQTAAGLGIQIGQFIERLHADESLRASEARGAAILATALDAVVTMDHTGSIVDWNPAAERTFGYRRAEAIGRLLGDLIVPPSLRARHYDGLSRYLATGEAHVLGGRIEITGMRADGSEFPVELAITRIPVDGPPLFTGHIRDISDRVRADGERERLTRDLTLLLESTGEGIYGVDLDGTCTFVNRAAASMLGRERGEILGHNAHDLMHHTYPDGTPYPREACPIFDAFRAGQGSRSDREVFWRADGTSFPVAYSSFPIFEGGAVRGSVVTFTDITERKRAERQQQDFVAMVAHDLKNPLATIKGNAQLMQRREPYNERRVAAIVAQSDRLERLIDDLRDSVRLDAQHIELRRAWVDLGHLIARVVDEAQALTHLHAIRFEGPGEPTAGWWDGARLAQVVENLITNAVKYAPDGGDILVRAEKIGGAARVTVRDRGIGIAPEELPRVFERFYRAEDAAKADTRGLGLGLFICKSLIEAHGGQILAESAPGVGSAFTFTLPLAHGPDGAV